MAAIHIERLREHQWVVTVEGGVTTEHTTTVTEQDVERYTAGKASHEELLRAAFEFLLARESNTSILRSFSLPTIGEYFSEFESEMRKRFLHPEAS